MADGQQAVERIRENYGDEIVESGSYRDQHWVELKAGRFVEICEWLRDDPANDYDLLLDVTAVHWPDEATPLQVVYHLYSFNTKDRLRLKLRTGETGPVPTLSGLWHSANWAERETYDMFGLRFEGHPDLRRILMPDDYTDYPLRKELPLYRG